MTHDYEAEFDKEYCAGCNTFHECKQCFHDIVFSDWLKSKITERDDEIDRLIKQKNYLNEYCCYLLGSYTEEEFKKISETYVDKGGNPMEKRGTIEENTTFSTTTKEFIGEEALKKVQAILKESRVDNDAIVLIPEMGKFTMYKVPSKHAMTILKYCNIFNNDMHYPEFIPMHPIPDDGKSKTANKSNK